MMTKVAVEKVGSTEKHKEENRGPLQSHPIAIFRGLWPVCPLCLLLGVSVGILTQGVPQDLTLGCLLSLFSKALLGCVFADYLLLNEGHTLPSLLGSRWGQPGFCCAPCRAQDWDTRDGQSPIPRGPCVPWPCPGCPGGSHQGHLPSVILPVPACSGLS